VKTVVVISDNHDLLVGLNRISQQSEFKRYAFKYFCSPGSEKGLSQVIDAISPIRLKSDWQELLPIQPKLVISAHCKQLFPAGMVNAFRCVNVHPGLNPYNRGWFPQVFSILNGLPTGATIHEIDEKLDHGKIIIQQEVPNYKWDTSLDIYKRVQLAEISMLETHLVQIIEGDYTAEPPSMEGNINLKADFNQLLELDLNATQQVGQTLDLLRALTHGNYRNAFFKDPETGKKVYVTINLYKEDE
jgi:methionyl-tRNA formyltransferase